MNISTLEQQFLCFFLQKYNNMWACFVARLNPIGEKKTKKKQMKQKSILKAVTRTSEQFTQPLK